MKKTAEGYRVRNDIAAPGTGKIALETPKGKIVIHDEQSVKLYRRVPGTPNDPKRVYVRAEGDIVITDVMPGHANRLLAASRPLRREVRARRRQ